MSSERALIRAEDATLAATMFIASTAFALIAFFFNLQRTAIIFLVISAIIIIKPWLAAAYKASLEIGSTKLEEFQVPPLWLMIWMTAPIRFFFPVKFRGNENASVKDQRILFVGNHQLLALDCPLLFLQIYLETGLFPRGLADRAHFRVPIWKQVIERLGAVEGTRENCRRLMEIGQPILVFPGGALEVFKGSCQDKYGLLWKSRSGFARIASEGKYKIVPFASVGIADGLHILLDIPAKYAFALIGDFRYFKATKPGASPDKSYVPVISPLITPQVNYIALGEPIESAQYTEAGDDKIFELREIVRRAVEDLILGCRRWQSEDKGRFMGLSFVRSIREKHE